CACGVAGLGKAALVNCSASGSRVLQSPATLIAALLALCPPPPLALGECDCMCNTRSGTTACTRGCAAKCAASALETVVATALMSSKECTLLAPARFSSVRIGAC